MTTVIRIQIKYTDVPARTCVQRIWRRGVPQLNGFPALFLSKSEIVHYQKQTPVTVSMTYNVVESAKAITLPSDVTERDEVPGYS